MLYNPEIHHRKSIRLKDYDYSECGYYYTTICTKNRECWFGDIVNGKMELSGIGKIVRGELIKTQQIRKNVKIDKWIIMPNHLHMILIINNVRAPRRGARTNGHNLHHKPQWKPNSLGSIINQFKSICTKRIWSIGFKHFQWQRNYYEHIIRNETELNRIREYIINNPLEWGFDQNNPNNTKKINCRQ